MEVIETTCTHTKKLVLELEKTLHHRTFRICMLLALGGVVLLAAGVFFNESECIYFGLFWAVLFLWARQ